MCCSDSSRLPAGTHRRPHGMTVFLALVFLISGLLSEPLAAINCSWALVDQETTEDCSSYDGGITWRCMSYVTNYWDLQCGGGGGDQGGGNPPGGGGGTSCPSFVAANVSAVDASVVGRTAFIRGIVDSDGTVYASANGPGAGTSGVYGPGAFSLPIDLNPVPTGSNVYTVIATTTGPAACPPVSSSATAVINRSSATAVASSSSGFYTVPIGGAFLVGTATIGGYDAFDRVTATPSGANLPTLWTQRAVARLSVTPQYLQTQLADVTAWHNIGGLDVAAMLPMQGSYIPADDPWDKTYATEQQLWVGYPPIQTSSSVDRILFSGVGIAETPWPQPNATATLE